MKKITTGHASRKSEVSFLDLDVSNVIPFPYPASCDEFPIYWTTAQVARHLRSQRKLVDVKKCLADVPPGMVMQADYYRKRADDEAPKQAKQGRKQKGPKLDQAPGAPEPKHEDFRNWDGTFASELYVYHDANGVPHTVVARWNLPGGDKKVLPYYWGEGPGRAPGWVQGRPPAPILYRLPEVLQGVKDGKEIVFLEGEKDVEGAIKRYKLEEHGYVFTTTLGGAFNNPAWNAWSDSDYSPLSGANATLVPDPDSAGSAWCEGVASRLWKLTARPPTVRVGTIPKNWYNGYAKAWGFGDPLPAAARDDTDVLKILTDTVPFAQWKKPPPDPAANADPNRFEDFDIDDIEGPCLDTAYFIDGLLPRRGVHVVYGPTSVGKTFVVVHRALHIAIGSHYARRETEKGLVIYVTGEGEQMFQNRIWLAKKKLAIRRGEAAFRGITDMPSMAKTEDETLALLAKVKTIAAEGRYAGLPVVVIIDTVSTALKGAREDEVGLGIFMANAFRLAKETDGLVIVIHHTGKDTTAGPRGAYLTMANPDSVEKIEENEAGTGGVITIEKMRDGAKDLFWTFERKVETLGEDPRGRPITTCHIELTSEPKYQKRKAEGKRGLADVAFDEAVNEELHAHGFDYFVDGDRRVKVRAVALANVRAAFGRRYATGKDGEQRAHNTISNGFKRALEASTRRYRARAVEIEDEADLARYKLMKRQAPKPKDGEYRIEIIWSIKHEPKQAETFEQWNEKRG